MNDRLYKLIESAATAPKAQVGLADNRLWKEVRSSVNAPLVPDLVRTQQPQHVVRDVEIIFERLGLEPADWERIDITDVGVAAAVLARLLNPEATDPVGDIRRNLAELCHQ